MARTRPRTTRAGLRRLRPLPAASADRPAPGARHPADQDPGVRDTASRSAGYSRIPRWPDGFLVTGDAATTFNPIYGQGMTVAALSALALRESLTRHGLATRRLRRTFDRLRSSATVRPAASAAFFDAVFLSAPARPASWSP